jgi:CheY-like chemotaxis protein
MSKTILDRKTSAIGGLWPVSVGRNQLESTIINLAGNARDAMPNGGKLTIETGKMYLPRLVSAEASAEFSARPGATPSGSKAERILVVEDENDVRASTVGMFEELSYGVLKAADGPAALRLLADHPQIRLLFTDVGLPDGLNGRQLADTAREMRPDLRVLYTTGYARNAIVHNGTLDPGVELMVKPFTYAALAAKIRAML